MNSGQKLCDVIVLGAGISGLSAAKLLTDEGYDVLVLEARERVGGRTYTIQNEHVKYVDLGGAYVGPTQNRLLRLARELGVQTHLTYDKGETAVHFMGKSWKSNDAFPNMGGVLSYLDTNNLFREIDRLAQEIPLEAPWKAPHAQEWDRMTMQDWMNNTLWTKGSRYWLRSNVQLNMCHEPHEVSFLWFLWYVKAAGGYFRINGVANGAQERKFLGGAQQISIKLAEKLRPRVLLGQPAVKVEQTDNDVTVQDIHGNRYTARHLICSIPLPLQQKLIYEPPLPSLRNQLISRVPMGSVIKTFVYYETPFWRKLGFSGASAIEDEEGLIGFSLDDTKPDGSHPALIAFILADKARRYAVLTREERRQRIAALYARVFQSDEALKPIHYEEMNWSAEQWSGGCYTIMMPPGFLTIFGEEIRKPVGRLYFAGTETATEWSGYMEGAIQAGERAAREIMYADGKISRSEIWQEEPEDKEVKPRPMERTFWESNLPSIPGLLRLCGFGTALSLSGTVAYLYCKHSKL